MAHEIGAVRAVASLDAAGVGVGVRDARSHLKLLQGGFQEASRESLREFERLADGVANSNSKLVTEMQKQVDAVTGVDRISKGASASTRAWVADLNRQAKSFDSVRASLDPLYASSKRYEDVVEQVNQAVRAGIATQSEADRVMALASKQYLGAATGAEKAAKATGGFLGELSPAQQNNARIFALQLNQIGQQGAVTGDYLGALSIQAADMLTIFGFAGIIMGGAIAVLGPMAKGLWETEDASKDAKKELEGFLSAISNFDAYADQASRSLKDLEAEFGDYAGTIREASLYLADVSIAQSMQKMREEGEKYFDDLRDAADAVDQMELSQKDLARQLKIQAQGIAVSSSQILVFREVLEGATADAEEAALAVGLLPNQVKELDAAFAAVRGAEGMEGIRNAAKSALDLIRQFHPEGAALPPVLQASVIELENILRASASTVHKMEEAKAGASELSGELSDGAIHALKLAKVDIASGVSAAAKEAATLADHLSVSLTAAYNISNLQSSLEYSGRGGDPRKVGSASYQMELGYKSVDDVVKELTRNLKKSGGAASKSSESAISKLRNEIAQRELLVGLTGQERKQYEAMVDVQRRLGKEASKHSKSQITSLAKRLLALEAEEEQVRRVADVSQEMSKRITDALFDPSSAADAAKNMIRQIAHEFIRGKIVLPIVGQLVGLQGVLPGAAGVVGGVAQSGLGILQGAGGVANLLGGGGALGAIGSGLGGVLSGGGLGSSFANLGGLVSGSVGGLGAIGAALPAVGVIAAAFSFFSSKTKLLDQGIRVTADGADTLVESFQRVQKSRFWGLSKKTRESYDQLSDEAAAPIVAAVGKIRDGVLQSASVLGLGADAWENFHAQFKVSTKGLSDAEAQEAVQKALGGYADQMAALVPGLAAVTKDGEAAATTLLRISNALVSVNDVLDLLGHGAYAATVDGGHLASLLADLFGGLDNMAGAANTYFAAFYSESERLEIQTRRMTEALAGMGLAMPANRAAFRSLVDGLDLSTERGRDLYARLISMSGSVDQIFTGQVSAMEAARQAADKWLSVNDGLRDLLGDLTASTALSGRSGTDAHRVNEGRLNVAMQMARGGDLQAAADIPSLARAYLGTARQTAASGAEYQGAVARLRHQISSVSAITSGFAGGARPVTPQPAIYATPAPAAEVPARVDAEVAALRVQNANLESILLEIARTNDRILKIERRREQRELEAQQ